MTDKPTINSDAVRAAADVVDAVEDRVNGAEVVDVFIESNKAIPEHEITLEVYFTGVPEPELRDMTVEVDSDHAIVNAAAVSGAPLPYVETDEGLSGSVTFMTTAVVTEEL